MKIAFLTPEFITEEDWHGGLSNYLYRISARLIDAGHKIHVFTISKENSIVVFDKIIVHKIKLLANNNYFLNKLKIKKTFFAVHASWNICRDFLKVNKKESFDVIQSSSYMAPAFFLVFKRNRPILVTRISSLQYYCDIAENYYNLDTKFIDKIERFLMMKSDGVYAPSILIKRKVKERFGLDISLIEPPLFSSEEEDSSFYENNLKDKKYFLFYGSLYEKKGLKFILDNLKDVLDQCPDFYFVFIGKLGYLDSGKVEEDYLKFKAGDYKNRVLWFDSLYHKQLIPVIRNSKAIILPSKIDNLPNTLIESMSLGKVIVGTYEGGFDQLVKDCENGYLVHYGDNKRFAEIIKLIADDDVLNNKIGILARISVEERLNAKARVNDLIEYFEKLKKKND